MRWSRSFCILLLIALACGDPVPTGPAAPAHVHSFNQLEASPDAVAMQASVPLTATFANLPATHDGHTAFTFTLSFSVEPSGLSYKTVRDSLLDVTDGQVTHARRATKGSNLAFLVTVQPSIAKDISLTVKGTTDCEATHAVCTADGRMLAGGTTDTVSVTDLITMTVADTEVEEWEGATLDFTVTLSRAASGNIEVWYRAYDGTATAGADYQAVGSSFTFAPGDTATTIPVVVLRDEQEEDSETVNFWLSAVRGMPASQITDPYAVGTIHDARPRPDLEVGASADDRRPVTGASFTLSATVTNSGDSASTATTLRYYRSADNKITSSDTEVGTDTVGALAPGGTSDQSVGLIAPSTAGTYFYGACIDAVWRESDTTDNCSARVRMDVSVPLTATYAYLPSTHDGATPFWFELRFSEAPAAGLSFVTVRDSLFDVTNGSIANAQRATRGSNLAFVVTVQPSAASAVSLSVRETTDCEAQHAVCTEDGRTLARGTSVTVAAAEQPPIVNNPSVEKFDIDLIFTSNVDSAQRAVVEAMRDTLEAIVRGTEFPDIQMPATVECGGVSVDGLGVVDDIAVIVDVPYIDGTSTRENTIRNTFALQQVCYRTTEHDFPVLSMIELDRDDIRTLLSDEEFRELVLHELLHSMGFESTTFGNLGLVIRGEYNLPYFIGESAIAAFVSAGGAQYRSDMVPLQSDGSHWTVGLLKRETMGTHSTLNQPKLSAITLQALADMGYTVDLRFAEPFQLPRRSDFRTPDGLGLDMHDEVGGGPVTVLDRHGTPVRVIQPPRDARKR